MKNNIVKKMMFTLAFTVVSALSIAGSAQAAPVTMADGSRITPIVTGPIDFAAKRLNVFSATYSNGRCYTDAFFYYSQDGRNLFGGPNFWINGKSAKGAVIDESAFFDANAYALYNPDVVAAVGTSKAALWNHYKTVGVYEGRLAPATTNAANAELILINIAQLITTPEMTDAEKIRAVHDWMCDYACYDYSFSNISHSLEGFMLNGTAVCDGYAKTFEYFMAVLNIPCETVYNNSHAWNRVFLEGQWISIDVCWDDPTASWDPNYKRYDYYLISEAAMSAVRSHTPLYYSNYYASI